MFYPTIQKYGNFPRKCPVKAGIYYIYNFNVNEEAFPMFFPGRRWRYLLAMYYKDRLLFKTIWNFRVEQKKHYQFK